MLPSGIYADIRSMVGANQSILTQQDLSVEERLNRVLIDIIEEIDRLEFSTMNDSQKKKAVLNLLEADRKSILVNARQLSMGKPQTFELAFAWNDKGVNKSEKIGLELLSEDNLQNCIDNICKEWGHPLESVTNINRICGMATKPYKMQFSKYPIPSGELDYEAVIGENNFRFRLMLGAMPKVKESEIDSNTKILMRLPRYQNEAGEWLSVTRNNLNEMPLDMLEGIRKEIETNEGAVDTVVTFDHPSENGKKVTVDVLGEVSFFFPSGRI